MASSSLPDSGLTPEDVFCDVFAAFEVMAERITRRELTAECVRGLESAGFSVVPTADQLTAEEAERAARAVEKDWSHGSSRTARAKLRRLTGEGS